MSVAKVKRQQEDPIEDLAERLATDINERAVKMSREERDRADEETRKIVARVQRRTP